MPPLRQAHAASPAYLLQLTLLSGTKTLAPGAGEGWPCPESLLCAWQSARQTSLQGAPATGKSKECGGPREVGSGLCRGAGSLPDGPSPVLPRAPCLSPQLRANSHANPVLDWWLPPARRGKRATQKAGLESPLVVDGIMVPRGDYPHPAGPRRPALEPREKAASY